MAGYKKNYLKIYLWQLVSFLLNFVSLFIVTPMLSGMQEIYGIYSVCAGLNVFLNYADLGFLVAGKKFAAGTIESGDIGTEKKFVGTSMSIFSAFSLLLSVGLIICIVNPDILISGVSDNPAHVDTARKLLCILEFSIIVTIFHKFAEFIYSLRLQEYKAHRVVIIGKIVTIASVPLYFFKDKYDIVGYYAFSQIVMFICCLYIIWRSKEIGYGLRNIVSLLKFDKKSFDLMKGLAFGGFVSTIAWVFFYEVDTIAISSLLGAKMVAIYAVGRSIQGFVRSINGIVYGPYNVRFYYFAGSGDVKGMRTFFNTLTSFLSILIIPIVAICIFAEPFTISWVGIDYQGAIIVMQILVFCFVYNCITNPCKSIIYSFNKHKKLLVSSVMLPIIFWTGVIATISIWGINSFAIFKLIACTSSAIYGFVVAKKILNFNALNVVLVNFILPLVVAFTLSYVVYIISQNYLVVTDKSTPHLLSTIFWIGLACAVSFVGLFMVSKPFRKTMISIVKNK